MKLGGVDWELGNADGIWGMDIILNQLYQKRRRDCATKFITLVNSSVAT